jgi:hypothetical protein
MARTPEQHRDRCNVVSLDDRRRRKRAPVVRLSPECDGIELLYANDRHPDKLFSLKILAWALHEDGRVDAMVPWLGKLMSAPELADPLNGRWEGYRFSGDDWLFTDAPEYKVEELNSAARFFAGQAQGDRVIQEIPDTIGTHAVFSEDGFDSISLVEVVSWRLLGDGQIQAMVADEGLVTRTPVLPGDDSLTAVGEHPHFRYFFQHGIANRLKERDPEALAAIAMLSNDV